MHSLLDSLSAQISGGSWTGVDPVQPGPADLEAISPIHDYVPDQPGMRLYGNQQATLIVDEVPFAAYWQLTEKKFVFHPMVWGRYVHSNAKRPDFIKRLPELSERMGTELPNGGLAFFYPNHYPLARMCGPELMYSAISQSEALAGYMHAAALHPDAGLEPLVDRVRDALFFSHEQGGVDLGVAQLELPLFHSNPEIILNGWLHSLFNLVDYAERRGDDGVSAYVERSLRFFLEQHHCWYDEERSITRYSETCPQRIILQPDKAARKKGEAQRFQTYYRSRTASLPDYGFTPVDDFDKIYSGFDNRITDRNPSSGALTAVTTCSGLYDTFIVSDAPFQLKLRPGGYVPERASPDGSGTWHTLASQQMGDVHAVEVKLADEEIFRGYPTNFNKANGRNFYHIQHIVALAYLAKTASFQDESIGEQVHAVAAHWHERTNEYDYRPRDNFEPLQTVLDAINRGKLLMQVTKADDLGL